MLAIAVPWLSVTLQCVVFIVCFVFSVICITNSKIPEYSVIVCPMLCIAALDRI